jgi:hypothetical protein
MGGVGQLQRSFPAVAINQGYFSGIGRAVYPKRIDRAPGFGKAEHRVQGVTFHVTEPEHFNKNPLDSSVIRFSHLEGDYAGIFQPCSAHHP